MKNKEYWNSKKELDIIEARLAKNKEALAEMDKVINERSENYFSEADKYLQMKTALLAFVISAVTGVLVAVLVVLTFLAQELKFSTIWLLPALIAFFLMIPMSYMIISLKHKNIRAVFRKLDEMASGIYRVDDASAMSTHYKSLYSSLNAVCENMQSEAEDLETALRIAHSANDAKASFLSNISHEIRTPINAIMGMNEMIIRESEEANIKNYSIEAKNSAEILLSLMDDMLDSSKLESGKLEIIPAAYPFSDMIVGTVNAALPKLKRKGLSFTLEADPDIPEGLFGDETRIRQCIKNILSNAIKFTNKGSVTFKIEYEKTGQDEIRLNFVISDTGIGIDSQDLEKIFEPFERLDNTEKCRYMGTGLGIPVTQRILGLMSSELKISSKKDEGTTVSFKLIQKVTDWKKMGMLEEKICNTSDSSEAYSVSFHAPEGRILVVDDSSVNLMIVTGLLKDTQITIDTAESGIQAVSLAKINRYDIIYVDHMMPEMDGLETMRLIRNDSKSLNRRVPIIVLTANVVPGGREEYLKEGFDDYLSKPVDSRVLEKSVMEYLPKHKVQLIDSKTPDVTKEEEPVRDPFLDKVGHVSDIVPALGINYAGGIDLYKKIVEEFTETGLSRADMLEQYFEQGDIKNFTIQVHALKSSARLLGNQKLSEFAEKLEMAGKAENSALIEEQAPDLLKQFREVVTLLQPLFEADGNLPEIDTASLKEALSAINEVVEAFDFDSADMIMEQLKKNKMPEFFAKDYSKLKTLMAEVARDDIIELVTNVLNSMK